jgi:quercetin dioxygenase-like cupin family protein
MNKTSISNVIRSNADSSDFLTEEIFMKLSRPIFFMAAGIIFGQSIYAHETGSNRETVIPLQRQSLADSPGKDAVVVTVNYGPGQVSVPHFHPGSVIAYVLEGEIISQLEGQEPITYKVGESWYEPPRAKHLISKNASATKPARLLVWLLVDKNEKTTIPLNQ